LRRASWRFFARGLTFDAHGSMPPLDQDNFARKLDARGRALAANRAYRSLEL